MAIELKDRVAAAVKHFWQTREAQHRHQGQETGNRDHGSHGAVTGGKQLDGFVFLIRDLLIETGLEDLSIFAKSRNVVLPGFFRPTKEWDLLVVVDHNLLATLECKSQVGPSFGNNYNNRAEEALGSATDLWTAYREGAFKNSTRPWLGYFMLLEQAKGSMNSVRVASPHFDVFPEFKDASYARRYELFCLRLVRERLYDSACLLLSDRTKGRKGWFCEPNPEISFERFAASLMAHAGAYAKLRKTR